MADPYEGMSDDEKKAAQEKELSDRLEKAASNTEAATALAKMTADPDIAKMLEAKKNGLKVNMTFGDEKPPEKDEEPVKDLDDMSRPELVEHIIGGVGKSLEELIDKKFEPIREELNVVGSDLSSRKRKSINEQLESARKKYSDFDNFGDEMLQLNKQTGGTLGVEELYRLVKTRAGGDVAADKRAESEKPDVDTSHRRPRIERDKPLPHGGRGFDQLLAEGNERVEKRHAEQE